MKKFLAIVSAIVPAIVLAMALAHGAPALAESPAASRLLGNWAVDVSRLPMPPEARPRSVRIGFHDAGGGKWTMRVDIVYADGTESHVAGTSALDGTATPVSGSNEADIAAMKLPVPGVLVVALGWKGMPASTRVYTIGADGDTMVETSASVGRDGAPLLRTFHFTRVE